MEELACTLVSTDAIYAPERLPERHLVLGGGRVLALLGDEAAARVAPLCAARLDATGCLAAPGLVDLHVHALGGGGEAGPASRTPEAQLSELLRAGVTTVVCTLGTDAVSRSLEGLAFKCAALEADGISAYFWGGAGYRLPAGGLTGSPQRDVALLPACLGVGEVAVSDARGSQPTAAELARLAADVRVGGLLGGKPAARVHIHVGGGAGLLRPLWDALERGALIDAFLPTHVGCTAELAADAGAWVAAGGRVDLTAGPEAVGTLIGYAGAGVDLGRVSASSDAYGSLPRFDAAGRLVEYGAAPADAQLTLLRALCLEEAGVRWPLERALPLATANPAAALGLGRRKGRLAVGADADVLLLDRAALEPRWVFARGEVVKAPGWVRGGRFEAGPGVRPHRPELGA
jgi:beta-aspartyl-dipeptidase (metallo-type)